MNKATKIVLLCIALCIAVYIGVFIGRSSITEHILTGSEDLSDGNTDINKGININTATAPMLEQIPGITPSIANNIIEYREEYGNFISTLELLEVDGITRSLYESIKIYVSVDD